MACKMDREQKTHWLGRIKSAFWEMLYKPGQTKEHQFDEFDFTPLIKFRQLLDLQEALNEDFDLSLIHI